jgi:hypothetical protein
MGVGDTGFGVGVAMGVCVATGVEEVSIVGKPWGVHAEQRIKMKRKTRDFIFTLP